MTAKEAIFEAMGWAEDAKDAPGQMTFEDITSWMQKSPQTPQSELEKHDKKNHPNGYKGGRCKVRGRLAQQGFDVRGYDAKVHNFMAPEGYDYNEKHGEGDEGEEGEGAEESASPELTALSEPEHKEVDGVEVTVVTEEDKTAVENIQKKIDNPSTSEEERAKLKEALESAQKAQGEITKSTEGAHSSIGPGPISDEEYERVKNAPEWKKFKQDVINYLSKGGDFDLTDSEVFVKDGIIERTFNDVIAELKAQGRDVDEWRESDVIDIPTEETEARKEEVETPEEDESQKRLEGDKNLLEHRDEPVPEEISAESPEEENIVKLDLEEETQEESSDIGGATAKEETGQEPTGKKDISLSQKAALQELAKRFGEAVEGIKKGVNDKKFSRLLSAMAHFSEVKNKWATTPNVSESRQDVRDVISEAANEHIDKSYKEQVRDAIDTLLNKDVLVNKAVSASLKDTLSYLKDVIFDYNSTSKQIQDAQAKYRRLCDQYGLDAILEKEDSDGETVPWYQEDGDKNHQKGGVTDSTGKGEKPLDVKVPAGRDKITTGSYAKVNEALDKIKIDASAFAIDGSDIELKEGVYSSEIKIKIPSDMGEKDANALIENIMKNFPGLKTKIVKEQVKGKEISRVVPANVFSTINPFDSTITFTLHNDTKGAVPHEMVINHPKFTQANTEGKLVSTFAVDSEGEPILIDFRQNPHILFAGTSGAGKNARQDAAITSLMAGKSPRDVQFIFVDGKGGGASFGKYKGSGYDLLPIAGQNEAKNRVLYLINEMRNRDNLFKQLGVEDLAGYNKKMEELVKAGKAPEGLPTHMPDIFLTIDEFGNVRNSLGKKKFDELITQIGNQGRSSGCHLMLATQNPTDDGGLSQAVKANMSTIVGMTTTNSVASRSILDETGLERLKKGGPVAIKSDDGVVYADGSYIDKDEIHGLFGSDTETSEKETSKPTLQESIDRIAQTSKEKSFLNKVASQITSGKMSILDIPSEIAEKTKQLLDAQGIKYTEAPSGEGRVRITPQKPEEQAESSSAEGATQPPSQQSGAQGTSSEPSSPAAQPKGEQATSEEQSQNTQYEEEPPLVDQKELDSLKTTRDKNRLMDAAKKFREAGNKLDTVLQKGGDSEGAQAQFDIVHARYNELRQRLGLPEVDEYGNSSATPDMEEPTDKAQEPSTVEGETSAESKEDKNIYWDESESASIQDPLDRDELKENALAIEQTRKAYEEAPEGSKEKKDARNALRKLLAADKKLRETNNLRQRDAEGRLPRTQEQEAEIKAEANNNEEAAQQSAKPQDDLTKLSEDDRFVYETEQQHYQDKISKLREDYQKGKISKEKWRDGTKKAREDWETTRKELGLENEQIDGSATSETSINETTPPERASSRIPKTNAPANEPTARSDEEPTVPTAPEKVEGQGRSGRKARMEQIKESAKSSAEDPEPAEEPQEEGSRSDEEGNPLDVGKIGGTTKVTTPAEPPTQGQLSDEVLNDLGEINDDIKKAMLADKGIMSLIDKANEAAAEHGRYSNEARAAAKKLTAAANNFQNGKALKPDNKKTSITSKTKESTQKESPKSAEPESTAESQAENTESTEAHVDTSSEPDTQKEKDIAAPIEANENIKALQEKVDSAKSKSSKAKAQKALNRAKEHLAEALRKAATPESGVQEIRQGELPLDFSGKTTPDTEKKTEKSLGEMTEEELQAAIEAIDVDGKMEPNDYKKAIKPYKDELKKRQAPTIAQATSSEKTPAETKAKTPKSPEETSEVGNDDRKQKISQIITDTVRKSSGNDKFVAPEKTVTDLLNAIDGKDADALAQRLHKDNPGSRKAFEAVTGMKLPNTNKGTYEAIDKFCGITPEDRQRIESERKATAESEAREKTQKAAAAAFEEASKNGPKFPGNKTLKQLIEDGYRFSQVKSGASSIWTLTSPDGETMYRMSGNNRKALGDNYKEVISGAVAYGEQLDKENESLKSTESAKKVETHAATQQKNLSSQVRSSSNKTNKQTAAEEEQQSKRIAFIEEAKKNRTFESLKKELDEIARSDSRMQELHKARLDAREKFGVGSLEADKANEAANEYYSQLGKDFVDRKMKEGQSSESPSVVAPKSQENKQKEAVQKQDSQKETLGTTKTQEPTKEMTQRKAQSEASQEHEKKRNEFLTRIRSPKYKETYESLSKTIQEAGKNDTSCQNASQALAKAIKEHGNDSSEALEARKELEKVTTQLKNKIIDAYMEKESSARATELSSRTGAASQNTTKGQSQKYLEEAAKTADMSKSPGAKTIEKIKETPKKVDEKLAKSLNHKFANVNREIQQLTDLLAKSDANLSSENQKQMAGQAENLKRGLLEAIKSLRGSNASFTPIRDMNNDVIGYKLSSFKDENGNNKSVPYSPSSENFVPEYKENTEGQKEQEKEHQDGERKDTSAKENKAEEQKVSQTESSGSNTKPPKGISVKEWQKIQELTRLGNELDSSEQKEYQRLREKFGESIWEKTQIENARREDQDDTTWLKSAIESDKQARPKKKKDKKSSTAQDESIIGKNTETTLEEDVWQDVFDAALESLERQS